MTFHNYSDVLFPNTSRSFFFISFITGIITVLCALAGIVWLDGDPYGMDGFAMDGIVGNLIRICTCCLAMTLVYKTKFIFITIDNNKINVNIGLKCVLVLFALIHLCLASVSLTCLFLPDFNGLLLHLYVVVGLCLIMANKKIGWPVFITPLSLLLIAQTSMMVEFHLLYSKESFGVNFFNSSYLGHIETSILAVEFIFGWFFIGKKLIGKNKN